MIRDENLRQVLIDRNILTPEQIDGALSKSPPKPGETRILLGDLLVQEGLLSKAKLREIVDAAPTLAIAKKASEDLPEDVRKAAGDPKNDLGKYIKLRMLGRGGMGVVLKAWDRNLRRYVAMKFLETSSPEDLKRFQREAQLAASLRHPNIVQVHEMGSIRGRAYIAMDFVQGTSLEDYGGKFTAKKLFPLMMPLCGALQYAHGRKIMHRDIKPHNVMVDMDKANRTQQGLPPTFITDFGLAKVVNMQSSLSMSGVVMGTPQYMSPEQASGELSKLDHRTDLYSLGATMYFLISGKTPVDGETPIQIVLRLQSIEFEPLRKHVPDLAADAETIVMKCLEKDKERRYQTADELKADMALFLRGEPIRARAPSMAYRVRQAVRKHKGLLAIGLLVLMSLIVVAQFVKLRQKPPDPPPRRVEAPPPPAPVVVADKSHQEATALFRTARNIIEAARTEKGDQERNERRTRLEEALALLGQAIDKYPSDAEFHHSRAEALSMLWRGEEALAGYDRALELNPDYAEARYRKLITRILQLPGGYELTVGRPGGTPSHLLTPLVQGIDPRELENDLNALAALEEYDAQVLCVEGISKLCAGNVDAAIENLADAIERKNLPEAVAFHAFARLLKGIPGALRRGGSGRTKEDLIEQFGDAIELDPNTPTWYVLRGVAFSTLKWDLGRAMHEAEEALMLVPRNADLILIHAYFSVLNKSLTVARRAVDEARAIHPGHPQIPMVESMIQWQEGHKNQANETLENAIAQLPEHAAYHYMLGIYLGASGNGAGSTAAFKTYVGLVPEHQRSDAETLVRNLKPREGLAGRKPPARREPAAAPGEPAPFDYERLYREAVRLAKSDQADAALLRFEELLRRLGPIEGVDSLKGITSKRAKEMMVEANLVLARYFAARKDPKFLRHISQAVRAGFREFGTIKEVPAFKEAYQDKDLAPSLRTEITQIQAGLKKNDSKAFEAMRQMFKELMGGDAPRRPFGPGRGRRRMRDR